ncbi:MAG: hypothetical protein HFG00_03135 [Oscillibacter sp.]|nr:hypothetical protein [Oscillibacter sp.]
MEKEKAGRRKVIYLLLSILVAAGIWLYADLTSGPNKTPQTRTWDYQDIPIEYTYESTLTDRGLMLVEEGTDQTIDLTLESTRWLLANLDRSQIRVTASLKDVTSAGEQRINYVTSYTDSKFNVNTVQRKNASFGMATVNIQELYSRTIDVSCELVGNVAESYSAGQVQLSHTQIEVQGQAEDIDPIRYAKVTLDIGDSAVESVVQDLEVQYYGENDQLLDKSGIYSSVETVQATLPVFVTKELQLVVDFVESPGFRRRSTEYRIEPSTITVSGDATQLKNVETLRLDKYDLSELGTSASQNFTTTNYPIILPEGCQNLSGVTRAALRIRFKDMASADVLTENIEWKNLAEGKRVESLTESLLVRIFGTQKDVAAVTGENVTVTVDLSDFSNASGTYTVPAEVAVSGGDIGISGEYQVQVTIREGEATPSEEESPEEGTVLPDEEEEGQPS